MPLRFERGETFRAVDDLPARVREGLARFSTSSVHFEERDPRVLGWAGPDAAEALVGTGG